MPRHVVIVFRGCLWLGAIVHGCAVIRAGGEELRAPVWAHCGHEPSGTSRASRYGRSCDIALTSRNAMFRRMMGRPKLTVAV